MTILRLSPAFRSIALCWFLVCVIFLLYETQTAHADTSAVCPHVWARTLTVGSRGEDVRTLQKFLQVRPGHETTIYGTLTSQAVRAWQEKYRDDILIPA